MIETIVDQGASAPTQLGSAGIPARNVRPSRAGALRFVSGAEEFGTVPSGVEACVSPLSQQHADAVLNASDEDFLNHVRRTQWSIAQGAPSFRLTRADHRYLRFRSKLKAALLDEPIEDGVSHPAEHVIDEALRTNPQEWRDWLSQALVEHYQTSPSISASIVRCVGRLEYDQVGNWGMHVADDALRHRDVEVREAAVRALEAWGGSEALEMLRRHSDTEPWVDAYVQQVIVDLSGPTS